MTETKLLPCPFCGGHARLTAWTPTKVAPDGFCAWGKRM